MRGVEPPNRRDSFDLTARQPRHLPSAGDPFTPREREILELIAGGLTEIDVAARLFISPATVKSHMEVVRKKCGAHTAAQAVAVAIRSGRLPAPPEGAVFWSGYRKALADVRELLEHMGPPA